MNLSQVSRTSIFTLICRVIGTEDSTYNFNDPMATLCLERLSGIASEEDRNWIERTRNLYQRFQARDVKASVQRVKTFDQTANTFIEKNPGCTVVNLACGFDTRFWRIFNEKCTYIEVDLPEVVKLKSELLKDKISYDIISGSVLDSSWIDTVTDKGNSAFLLLAEGLFMYLPEVESIETIRTIGNRFTQSQIVMDLAPIKYTGGIWKRIIQLEGRITLGLDLSMTYGVRSIYDIETYSSALKVIGKAKGTIGPTVIASIGSVQV
jgi:O-methyltransferase involved in polyketide biosynthesis